MRTVSFLTIALLGGLTAAPGSADCVFVNMNRIPNQVQAFRVGSGGALAEVTGSPFLTEGGNGGLGLATAGGYLYAVNTFLPNGARITGGGGLSGSVSGFTIAADCTLALLPDSPWFTEGTDPHSAAANPAGTRLFVGNLTGGTIKTFDIAVDGSLSIDIAPSASQPSPADLGVSPDGAHLFVSHGDAGLGVYDVALDGTLTAAAGSPFASGGPPLFQGNRLAPGGGRFYAADNANAQIAGFTVGAGGALSPLPGSPYTTGSGPADLVLSPRGFLFASNSLGSTLGGFAVAGDGSLAPVPGSPFAASSPDGLAINPNGSFLYTLGHTATGFFQLDVSAVSAAGALTPVAGSPFAPDTAGGASRLVYYPQIVVVLAELPTLSPLALGILAALLTLGAFAILKRRAPQHERTGRARPD